MDYTSPCLTIRTTEVFDTWFVNLKSTQEADIRAAHSMLAELDTE
ncbi:MULTISPECIES: hypothetical protein [Paraburkholderia]|uniref:Uncharacterized protein n=1 Tax=Paraburkholderia ferrariae TaxID=386056 RepID=A0ABU9RRV5_9BURK|nr:hypothetical protein [Paraburkholderia nodosa]